MQGKTTTRMTRTMFLAGLALALLFGAASADAQGREGRWEFTLGALYQLGTQADFEGGSSIDTEDDFGFSLSTGYNINDKLNATFGFSYADIGYDANVISDEGADIGISGEYETWGLSANLIYNFSDGEMTPFIGAGIGWSWIDTNVPTGLPDTVCWWDPWWGYVCYTDYPTATTDALSYQAMAGLRYEFSYSSFMRLWYASKWLDLDQATTTPRFDAIGFDFGWMF